MQFISNHRCPSFFSANMPFMRGSRCRISAVSSSITVTTAATITEKKTAKPIPLIYPSLTENSNNAATDTATAAFRDYQSLFLSQRTEAVDRVTLQLVEGSLPLDFPRGIYYLIGPGIFEDDHGSIVHPLDGHGYLRAFEFCDDGKVRYRARYIDTEAKKEEYDKGKWRFKYRGPFSLLRGGKKFGNVKVTKNVANTTVVEWGGRLLCFWEGGEPYEVDRETLDTIGPFDIEGKAGVDGSDQKLSRRNVAGAMKMLHDLGVDVAAMLLKPVLRGVFNMPKKRLLSHYKIDTRRKRLLLVSCNSEDMLLPHSNFTFYELDINFKMKHKRTFVIPDHLMIHDWAFTDNHYILFGNRIKINVPGSLDAISGLSPMISALSVNPREPTTPIYVLPRFSEASNESEDWKIPIQGHLQLWVIHVSNAFEEKNRNGELEIQLQASACSYDWFQYEKMFGYDWRHSTLDPRSMNQVDGKEELLPHLVQVRIKLDRRVKCTQCSITPLASQHRNPADFPTINPNYASQKNFYVYAGASSGSCQHLPHFPFDSVKKYDSACGSMSSWWAGKRNFIGEPIFVPKNAEEDGGYIIVVEYAVSKQRCYLVVLDAKKIGPNAMVAKLEIPRRLTFPLGFHGFWSSH